MTTRMMKQYMAISPSMNDQLSGNTWLRTLSAKWARPSRSSNHRPARPAARSAERSSRLALTVGPITRAGAGSTLAAVAPVRPVVRRSPALRSQEANRPAPTMTVAIPPKAHMMTPATCWSARAAVRLPVA